MGPKQPQGGKIRSLWKDFLRAVHDEKHIVSKDEFGYYDYVDWQFVSLGRHAEHVKQNVLKKQPQNVREQEKFTEVVQKLHNFPQLEENVREDPLDHGMEVFNVIYHQRPCQLLQVTLAFSYLQKRVYHDCIEAVEPIRGDQFVPRPKLDVSKL